MMAAITAITSALPKSFCKTAIIAIKGKNIYPTIQSFKCMQVSLITSKIASIADCKADFNNLSWLKVHRSQIDPSPCSVLL